MGRGRLAYRNLGHGVASRVTGIAPIFPNRALLKVESARMYVAGFLRALSKYVLSLQAREKSGRWGNLNSDTRGIFQDSPHSNHT